MKRVLLIILCSIIPLSIFADVRNVGDAAQVQYIVLDTAGDYVTGQNVNIKIKRVSDGLWYDFSDGAFKASGWTVKTSTLTEDAANEHYYYTFTPPVADTTADQYIAYLTNATSGYEDAQAVTLDYTTEPGAVTLSAEDIAAISAGIDVPDPWATTISTTAYSGAGTAGRKLHEAWRERLRR